MGLTLRYLFAMLCGAVPALAMFLVMRPLRLRRLERAGLSSPLLREAALALFWMYCGGAALLGLTPRWVVRSLAGLPLGAGEWGLYVYAPDGPARGRWIREDGTRALDFAALDGAFYYLDAETGALVLTGQKGDGGGRIPWRDRKSVV